MTPSWSKGLSALSREGRGVLWRQQAGVGRHLPTRSLAVGGVLGGSTSVFQRSPGRHFLGPCYKSQIFGEVF